MRFSATRMSRPPLSIIHDSDFSGIPFVIKMFDDLDHRPEGSSITFLPMAFVLLPYGSAPRLRSRNSGTYHPVDHGDIFRASSDGAFSIMKVQKKMPTAQLARTLIRPRLLHPREQAHPRPTAIESAFGECPAKTEFDILPGRLLLRERRNREHMFIAECPRQLGYKDISWHI